MRPPGSLLKAGRVAVLAPPAAAGVFLVVLAINLRRLVEGAFWNSDVASLPLVAGTMAHRAGGVAHVSVANYYSTILFDMATRALPAHRGIWEGFSLAASLLGVALLGRAATRAAGWAAGLLTAAIALCAGPIVFAYAYPLRGPTWFTGALLVAWLVALATRPSRSFAWTLVAVVGLVAGVNLASDPLLLISGVAPMLGAAAGSRLLVPGPATRLVLKASVALTLVAAATYLATGSLMHALGFRIVPTSAIELAPLTQVTHNLALLAHDILAFGNEEFPRAPSGVLSIPSLVTIALCLAAAIAVLWGIASLRRGQASARTPASALYLLFWAFSALGVAGAFAFSTLPIGDVTSARYVVPVFFALAAGAGVGASRAGWPRLAVSAVATAFCVLSTLGIGQLVTYFRGYPLAAEGPGLITFLEARGLTRGYASYWDALGLTWATDSKIAVYPVVDCGAPADPALCPFAYNTVTTWYRPRPGMRTFVAVGLPVLPLELTNPVPQGLGTPIEVDHVGAFTVYVYRDDVGARFQG